MLSKSRNSEEEEDKDILFAAREEGQFSRRSPADTELEDQDSQLAKLLQEEEEQQESKYNDEDTSFPITLPNKLPLLLSSNSSLSSDASFDPELIALHHVTLTDPTPISDIRSLFLLYNTLFFSNHLGAVAVSWSKTMRLCAGLCKYGGQGTMCEIRLSQPLLQYRTKQEQIETLLHEMIHAYLFVTEDETDREAHGPTFQHHMKRINKTLNLKLSVFHKFHDEVDHFRTHIWRCNGKCRESKPFFGWVKRSMNRAPGPHDHWWARHQEECGGQYEKISEPDPNEKQKERERKKREKKEQELEEKKTQEKKKDKKAGVKQVDLLNRRRISKGKDEKKEKPSISSAISFPSLSHQRVTPPLVDFDDDNISIGISEEKSNTSKEEIENESKENAIANIRSSSFLSSKDSQSSSTPDNNTVERELRYFEKRPNDRGEENKRKRSEILIESSSDDESDMDRRRRKIVESHPMRETIQERKKQILPLTAATSLPHPTTAEHSETGIAVNLSSSATAAPIRRNTNILDLMKKRGEESIALTFLSKITSSK